MIPAGTDLDLDGAVLAVLLLELDVVEEAEGEIIAAELWVGVALEIDALHALIELTAVASSPLGRIDKVMLLPTASPCLICRM